MDGLDLSLGLAPGGTHGFRGRAASTDPFPSPHGPFAIRPDTCTYVIPSSTTSSSDTRPLDVCLRLFPVPLPPPAPTQHNAPLPSSSRKRTQDALPAVKIQKRSRSDSPHSVRSQGHSPSDRDPAPQEDSVRLRSTVNEEEREKEGLLLSTREDFQKAGDFQALVTTYRKVLDGPSAARAFPSHRLIECYFHLAPFRQDVQAPWHPVELLHTLQYLQQSMTTSQSLSLCAFMIGRSRKELYQKLFRYIVTHPDSPELSLIEDEPRALSPPSSKPSPMVEPLPPREVLHPSFSSFSSPIEKPSWSQAWFGMLMALPLEPKHTLELNRIFFSPAWIQTRHQAQFLASPPPFDPHWKLIKQLRSLLGADSVLAPYLPFFAAAISNQPLAGVLQFMHQKQYCTLMNEAEQVGGINATFLSRKQTQVQSELSYKFNMALPTDQQSLLALLAEKKQQQAQVHEKLLLSLCRRAEQVRAKFTVCDERYVVVNTLDDVGVPTFEWITSENFISNSLRATLHDFAFLTGCQCREDCYAEEGCQCVHEMLSGDDQKLLVPPYKDGKLNPRFRGNIIHECNLLCKCRFSCHNRLVQHQDAPELDIIIFKDAAKGWGVRTLQVIPQGTYVSEYLGELVTSEQAEERGKEYDRSHLSFLLDLDLDGKNFKYTLDATNYGNISRFYNHSCSPNLQIYHVFVDVLDPNRPKICFFAKRDIAPGEELTFDYKYTKTNDQEGRLRCHCGALDCRKWLL